MVPPYPVMLGVTNGVTVGSTAGEEWLDGDGWHCRHAILKNDMSSLAVRGTRLEEDEIENFNSHPEWNLDLPGHHPL